MGEGAGKGTRWSLIFYFQIIFWDDFEKHFPSALCPKPLLTFCLGLANMCKTKYFFVFHRILENGVRSLVTDHASTCLVGKCPISLY